MDFCKWRINKKDKTEVDWPKIEKELNKIGSIENRDILSFNQVNSVVNGVKISFYGNKHSSSPIDNPLFFTNNLKLADLESIGALKIEVTLRRAKFRDYYDLYCICKELNYIKK